MPLFLFRIFPWLNLILLAAAVVLIAKGYSRNRPKLRLAGMGLAALFVLLSVVLALNALARL